MLANIKQHSSIVLQKQQPSIFIAKRRILAIAEVLCNRFYLVFKGHIRLDYVLHLLSVIGSSWKISLLFLFAKNLRGFICTNKHPINISHAWQQQNHVENTLIKNSCHVYIISGLLIFTVTGKCIKKNIESFRYIVPAYVQNCVYIKYKQNVKIVEL